MPDPISAVVGGTTLLSGVMGSQSADKASRSASRSEAAALDFERQKYADWKDTYGGIEDNLSEYYNSLTPEYYEARGLEAFQKEQQVALEGVRETLAQRGIEDSGIAAATEISFAQEGAGKRADIRADAPSLAAEEKRSFLQVGMNQNPGESYSRALASSATSASRTARESSASAGQAVGSAITTIGTGLSDYLNKPDYTQVGTGSTGLGKYEV